MLRMALAFFVLAIIAGLFGFGAIAGVASNIAVILFWIFIVLFAFAIIANMGRSTGSPV